MPQIRVAVVGTRYRGPEAFSALSLMRPSDPVRLVRESENAFDSYAVQVWYLGVHVGYIALQANGQLARAMDAGSEPKAEVVIAAAVRSDRVEVEPLLTVSWGDPR